MTPGQYDRQKDTNQHVQLIYQREVRAKWFQTLTTWQTEWVWKAGKTEKENNRIMQLLTDDGNDVRKKARELLANGGDMGVCDRLRPPFFS